MPCKNIPSSHYGREVLVTGKDHHSNLVCLTHSGSVPLIRSWRICQWHAFLVLLVLFVQLLPAKNHGLQEPTGRIKIHVTASASQHLVTSQCMSCPVNISNQQSLYADFKILNASRGAEVPKAYARIVPAREVPRPGCAGYLSTAAKQANNRLCKGRVILTLLCMHYCR